MPEQRDLRADLDLIRQIKEAAAAAQPQVPIHQMYWDSIRAMAVMEAHALERAIVAEEAVRCLVAILNVHTNLCVFCPDGAIVEPTEYDSAGYRVWACGRNQPRDPNHIEECFADAVLAQARAKAGL